MIRVVQIGLGPIGIAVARQLASRKGFKIVGAADIDPTKVGKELGAVCGPVGSLPLKVLSDVSECIEATRPDIAVLCTNSSLARVFPQIEAILKLKVPIVSTTEELAYPVMQNRDIATKIDALARRASVAVLGTGVNPGFVMDALPIALSCVCESVSAIEVDRVQDARRRRLPFQMKIGSGLTRQQFMERVRDGSVRHVGLAESVTMIGDAMGWKLERVTDEIQPKISQTRVSSEFMSVEAGLVCGLTQDGVGYRNGEPIIKLHMEAYLGAPESYDAVRITGSPPVNVKIASGVHGDIATASITVNSIPKVIAALPGLRTMKDMVLPGFFGG